MSTPAIHKLLLGRSAPCSICGKYSYCQHQDAELHGDICWGYLPFDALAEMFLRAGGFHAATKWDEK